MGCQKQINYLTESKSTLKVVWNRSNFEHPFGMLMPGRNWEAAGIEYQKGFNGMEKDDEVKGSGNSYTTEFRQYDSRLGRWLSLDPITHPMYSPYSAFDNNPIYYVDPSGADSDNENKDDLSENNKGQTPSSQQNGNSSPKVLFETATAKSETLVEQLKENNLTEGNFSKTVSFKPQTSETFEDGTIIIDSRISAGEQLLALSHELTNLSANKEFIKNNKLVMSGVISPAEYAKRVLENEAVGQVNQVKVLKDLKISATEFEDGTPVNDYLSKKITSDQLLIRLKATIVKDNPGAITYYTEQGERLKAYGVKSRKIKYNAPWYSSKKPGYPK